MSGNSILSVEHLSKLFKSGERILTVLHDVSFDVEAGSACAIVGPSGSGKTTLIAIFAGLERPREGTGTFNGVPLPSPPGEELSPNFHQVFRLFFSKFSIAAFPNGSGECDGSGRDPRRKPRPRSGCGTVRSGRSRQPTPSLSHPAVGWRATTRGYCTRFHEPSHDPFCR